MKAVIDRADATATRIYAEDTKGKRAKKRKRDTHGRPARAERALKRTLQLRRS
jgi:hypothetical protein